MMSDFYKTIKAPAEGLYKEKMSKFISFAHPIESAEEAKEIIKKYQKSIMMPATYAGHICLAEKEQTFSQMITENRQAQPEKPILGQINSFELTNILIVVIRYFGGIKLGTSGLIVAYREAAERLLEQAR